MAYQRDPVKKRAYDSWFRMIDRCYNSKNKKYPMWGGRGILVCEFLRASPNNLKISIGEKPDGMSLDRKENNSNYSCGECAECLKKEWVKNIRWATPKQQARNTRRNNFVSISGETKCISEWSEISGINRYTIYRRLKRGWPLDKILDQDVRLHKN